MPNKDKLGGLTKGGLEAELDRLKLRRMLEKLKTRTGLGGELALVWIPGGSKNLSGEVKDNRVYVYDKDLDEAAQTLVEEFIEYAISEATKPYISLLNAILKCVNEEAYRRRDRVAKALTKILKPLLLEE